MIIQKLKLIFNIKPRLSEGGVSYTVEYKRMGTNRVMRRTVEEGATVVAGLMSGMAHQFRVATNGRANDTSELSKPITLVTGN